MAAWVKTKGMGSGFTVGNGVGVGVALVVLVGGGIRAVTSSRNSCGTIIMAGVLLRI